MCVCVCVCVCVCEGGGIYSGVGERVTREGYRTALSMNILFIVQE